MNKSPIEIAIGQTNILIEDEVCKAVGKVGIYINKEELLKALKAYEFVEELTNYIFEYPDDDYMTMECLCRKLFKYGLIDKKDGEWTTDFIERKDEPTWEQVKEYCNKRCLDIVDSIMRKHWYKAEEVAKDINRRVEMGKKAWNARHIEDEPQTERSER